MGKGSAEGGGGGRVARRRVNVDLEASTVEEVARRRVNVDLEASIVEEERFGGGLHVNGDLEEKTVSRELVAGLRVDAGRVNGGCAAVPTARTAGRRWCWGSEAGVEGVTMACGGERA